MDRRRYLGSVAGATVLWLAGCNDDPSDDGDGPTTTGSPGEGTPTATPGESPSPPTNTATPTGEANRTGSATPTGTSTPTATPTPTRSPRPEAAAEVVVGPAGESRFDPETVTIAAGEAIRWIWDSDGHDVEPGDIPGASDWSGTPGGEGETFDAGFVFTDSLEVTGTYEYHCTAHRVVGMEASFTVE